MCGGGGSVPTPPPALPAAPVPAVDRTQAAGTGFREADRKRRGTTKGGTLLTGPRGVTDTNTAAPKTLLGG